jgi:hypothetical protein
MTATAACTRRSAPRADPIASASAKGSFSGGGEGRARARSATGARAAGTGQHRPSANARAQAIQRMATVTLRRLHPSAALRRAVARIAAHGGQTTMTRARRTGRHREALERITGLADDHPLRAPLTIFSACQASVCETRDRHRRFPGASRLARVSLIAPVAHSSAIWGSARSPGDTPRRYAPSASSTSQNTNPSR